MGNIPGPGTEKSSTPRRILLSQNGAEYLPGGRVISGANSRDPGNTGDLDTIRCGMVLGKRNVDNKYAPSIIGLVTTALAAGGATLVVSAAAGDELVRRVAVGGTFKLVGTVAAGVPEVQTCTLGSVVSASGTFTIGYKGEFTAEIAYNATVSTINTAVALLKSVIEDGGVTLAAGDDPASDAVQVWTFTTNGPREMMTYDLDLIGTVTGTQVWVRTTLGQAINTVQESRALGFSAESAGSITLGANSVVPEVQTITLDAVLTAGTYTYIYRGQITAAIDFDATQAEQLAALELLSTVNPGDITPEASNEPDTDVDQTFTFAGTLGDVGLISMNVSTATPSTAASVAVTTTGEIVAYATTLHSFAIGSMLMPTDGSEKPLTLLVEETGIKVSEPDGTIVDKELPRVLISGQIITRNIVDYPTDEYTQVWLKDQLGSKFLFDDNF